MPQPNQLFMLLLEAKSKRLGIVVESDDPLGLRQSLYTERRKDMLEFGCLSFVLSPDNPKTDLWIINRDEDDLGL